jgi:hypothetical protein
MLSKWTNQMQKVFEVQKCILDVHPLLSKIFPIAVVEDDQFFIFDTHPTKNQYRFIKQAQTPMTFPPRIRAAFPMACYDSRMACVVTKDVFDSDSGYVTIFHEFIHCQQNEICEPKIKNTLKIAQKAQEAQDHTWELNHPFPYDAREFITCYNAFLARIYENDINNVLATRKKLKQILRSEDYEYMVWQEWKEGFARLIENKIKRKLGLKENHGGTALPFTRVLFYEGGAQYIEHLSNQNPKLITDIEHLFNDMFV